MNTPLPITKSAKIMIIRHAEKPYQAADKTQYNGVTKHGELNNEALIVRGWQRAGALAAFFTPLPNGDFMNASIEEPATLFASKVEGKSNTTKQKIGSKSKRPKETITPLSDKLGVKINVDFDKGEEQQVADAAMACDGVVLICWEHESIPAIVQNIPISVPLPPTQWPKDQNGEGRFDIVWVFDLASGQNQYSFSTAYQCLLSGDSSS